MAVGRSFSERRNLFRESNRITEAAARESAKAEARMTALRNAFPNLADQNPSFVVELANNMAYDDVQMMEAARDTLGAAGIANRVQQLQDMDDIDQRAAYSTMNPIARDALVGAGWELPEVETDRGLFGDIMSGVGGVLGGVVDATKVVAKPVKWGLEGMNWASEAVQSPTRVAPIMDSKRRLMEETGLSAEDIMQMTGIDMSNAGSSGKLTSRVASMTPALFGAQINPLEFAKNPGDLWGAVRTWWQQGVEGDDDYLATVQYEVYQQLEDTLPGEGRDALRWLKEIAKGHSFADIAEDEGLTGDEIQPFIDKLGRLTAGEDGKKALARLESGRVSYGRTAARALEGDWDADVSKGMLRYVSGSTDAIFQLAADPTLVGGKITKGVKAARWALKSGESFEQLHRWQYLARVADEVATKGEDAVDVNKAFTNVPARSWRALDIGAHKGRLMAEAKAVYEPAKAVSDAARSGDWKRLVRKYPGFEPSIKDIQKFNAAVVEAGGKSMADDVGQVFEFYKWAATGRTEMGTLADDTLRQALRTNSYKLFGHDGAGHFVVPHATAAQRARINSTAKVADWFWDRGDDPAAMKELESYYKAVRDEADGVDAAARERNIERSRQTELALSDDEAVARDAREALAKLDEAERLAKEGADDMEVDPTTLGFVAKSGRWARDQVRRFATTVGVKVPERDYVMIGGQATGPEDFGKFAEMVALIKGETRAAADRRYNLFLAATPAGRHAMVNRMILEMGDAAGITETAAGREILRKHIEKNNQIYGYHDLFRQRVGEKLHTTHQAVFEKQLADAVSIPNFREMVIATRNMNKLRLVAGTVRNSHAEAAMTRVWKPLTMFRMGFPLRAGADEALQFMGRVGAGGYLRERVLRPWAGLREIDGTLARDHLGEVISAPRGAIQPVRKFFSGLSEIAQVSDEGLEFRVREAAYAKPEWATAGPAQRDDILKAAKTEVKADLSPIPKSIRYLDDLAKDVAAWSSETFHKVIKDDHFLSRAELAKRLLKDGDDYAERLRSYRLMLQHPLYEHAYSQMFGHAFTQGASDMSVIKQALNDKVITLQDPNSESGARAVRMNYGGDFAWVGDDDLGAKIHHYNHLIESMAENPSTRAAMRAYAHYVPQGVVDEFAKEFGSFTDATGLDIVKGVRSKIRTGVSAADPDQQAQVDEIMKQLQMAAGEHTDDLGFSSLDELISQFGFPKELGTLPELQEIYGAFERLSPTARLILFRDLNGDMLTNDLTTIVDRMVNGSYNALRNIDNAKNIRKMVQASYVDGRPVAQGIPDGHTRFYSPMIDRRAAADLVGLLSDRNRAVEFGQLLAKQLGSRNLMAEGTSLWDALAPQQGFDLQDWMAGLKASIMQSGANYIPAGLAGSSNYRLAEALRDTFAEILPNQTFRPSIGYIDHPDDLFSETFGIKRMGEKSSVVNLAPYQAEGMQAIDPDNLQRLLKVEVGDKTMWLGQEELSEVAGTVGRAHGIKEKAVYRSRAFTRFDRANDRMRVNRKLIQEDFRSGMSFLKGEGGTFRTTRSSYGFDDPDTEAAASQLEDVLDSLTDMAEEDITLSDMIGKFKMNGMQPVPYKAEMQGHGVWDDFVEIAQKAKRQPRVTREEWTDAAATIESKNVKAALDRLGAGADGLTAAQYERIIIQRAKALEILRAPGHRGVSLSNESVEREMDALTFAWHQAGLTPTEEMAKRLNMVIGKGQEADFKVLGEIWTSGVTEEAAVRRTAQNIADEVRKVFTDQQTNEPMHQLVLPLLGGDHSIDRILRTHTLDQIPHKAFGPKLIANDETTYNKVLRGFYDGVADPTIAGMARKPMAADMFHKKMAQFQPIHDMLIVPDKDQFASDLLRNVGLDAETFRPVNEHLFTQLKRGTKHGDDADDPLTTYAQAVFDGNADKVKDALVKLGADADAVKDIDIGALKEWHMMRSNALEEQVHRASISTMESVAPYVDNHRQRSMFQEFLGPVFLPFYYAEELFLRRFARGMYETPHMLRKGQLTMNGLRNMGVVRTDEHGEEIMIIPGSDIALETMAKVARAVTGNDAMRVDFGPLSLKTEYLLPGWNTDSSRFGMGPLIGLGMEAATRRFPEAKWAGRMQRSYWEYLVPGQIAGGYKLFASQPDHIVSAETAAITMLEASGYGLPDDASASETEEYLEDVRSVTRAVGAVRWATGMVFGGATPVDNSAQFRKEYTDLLGQGVSFETAMEIMIDNHGPNGVIYTIFGSDNLAGAPLPSTARTYEFMLAHDDMITDDPETLAWLMPQPTDGEEFDYRAFNESMVVGLRQRRTPEEFINEIRIAQAAPEYFEFMEERRAGRQALVDRKASSEEKDAYDDATEVWKTTYLNQHPLLEASFSNDAKERRQKVLRTLPAYIEAGVGAEQGEALKPLLDLYTAFKSEYDSYSGQSSKAATAIKKELSDSFYTEAWTYVKKHPEAGTFWNSVIRPELPDNGAEQQTKVS